MRGSLKLTNGRKLLSPNGLSTRPTTSRVREALMNVLSCQIKGSAWLDLFSGSGAIGCEALQRGARSVIAVEINRRTAQVCKSNLSATVASIPETKHVQVICNEVLRWLNKGATKNQDIFEKPTIDSQRYFDFVYLDPPYQSDIYRLVLQYLIKGCWLKKDSVVICEYSTEKPLPTPDSWVELDRRFYGNSALLLTTPQQNLLFDTDSKPLPTTQTE